MPIGTADLYAGVNNKGIKFDVMASIWSPHATVKFGKISVELYGDIGAVGGEAKLSTDGFKLEGAAPAGGGISVDWDDN